MPSAGGESRAERQLAASAEFYHSLFEHNPDAVYALDLDARFTDVNPGVVRLTGYTPEELIGAPIARLVAPESVALVQEETRRVLDGTPQRLVATVIHKHGHRLTLRCVKLPIVVDGRVVGVFGLAVDVTEQRRAATESRLLAQAGALLGASLDAEAILRGAARLVTPHVADGCLVDLFGAEGALTRRLAEHCEASRRAVLAALGTPAGAGGALGHALRQGEARLLPDLCGAGLADLTDDEAHREAFRTIGARSAIVVPIVSGERTHGALWLLTDATSSRRYERGDLAFARTLTDRVAAALENARLFALARRELAERERSEQRFRALVEHGTDLIAVLDDETRLLYGSPSHERILGYSADEMARMDLWTLLHPEDLGRAKERVAEVRERGAVRVRYPLRLRAKSGEWRALEVMLTDLRDDAAVRGVVANSHDVTDRQRLEAQLQQAQKLEAIGRLAGGIAHDFNNLLTAVAGNASLTLAALPPDAPVREEVEEIARAAERATQLTRQLLAFSRNQMLRPTVLDVNDVVRGMERMLGRLLGARVTLRAELGERLPPVRIDRTQLEQVLMNLAVNARDAMPEGGALTIETSAVREDETAGEPVVRVVVRDTGHGMSDEVRARAFEPFFTTKERGRGTGLGLATVYGIVAQSGGRLSVESALGRGTTFTIVLPSVREAPRRATPERAAAPRPPGATRETVLVVDDQDAVRRVAERILAAAGYRVLAARDAPAALALAERHAAELALVLTDADMPIMNGFELARELPRRGLDVPVVVVSGHPPPEGRADVPAPRFLDKPFTIEQLVDAVRGAISAHRTSRRASA